MVAARVDNAEVVARGGDVKIQLFGHGGCRIRKINGDDTAHGARHLIHQPAGLAEKLVFRILRQLCDLHIGDFAAVVQMIFDIADHILKRGGGGKPGAFQHAGGGIGVKPADGVALFAKARAHPGDNRIGVGKPVGAGGGVIREIHHILRESFGFDPHGVLFRGGSHGDDVKVYGSRHHTAVIVVGMVAGKLAPPGDRKQVRLTPRAVQRLKFGDGFFIARFLRRQRFAAVKGGQACVQPAGFQFVFQFGSVHFSASLYQNQFRSQAPSAASVCG